MLAASTENMEIDNGQLTIVVWNMMNILEGNR